MLKRVRTVNIDRLGKDRSSIEKGTGRNERSKRRSREGSDRGEQDGHQLHQFSEFETERQSGNGAGRDGVDTNRDRKRC